MTNSPERAREVLQEHYRKRYGVVAGADIRPWMVDAMLAFASTDSPEPMIAGWRPIETAPRDGTVILAYYPEGDWEWVDEDETISRRVSEIATVLWHGHGQGGRFEGNTYFITPDGEPTHWMPLPTAPSPSTVSGDVDSQYHQKRDTATE